MVVSPAALAIETAPMDPAVITTPNVNATNRSNFISISSWCRDDVDDLSGIKSTEFTLVVK